MVGLVIGAAILGIIIAVMEQGEFPGWGPMIFCAIAAVVPAAIVNTLVPPGMFIVGLAVGALCATVAIAATCGMSVKRAAIAACIFLACQTAISAAFFFLFAK